MFSFFKKKSLPLEKEKKDEIVYNFGNCQDVAKYFESETGITFDSKSSILKSKLSLFCKKNKISNFSILLKKIKSDKFLEQELINVLTTNVTYFNREFTQISSFVSTVLKDNKNSIKILCAPSSTGEEPYSLVIALLEVGFSRHIEVMGIDSQS